MGREERANREINGDKRKSKSLKQMGQDLFNSDLKRMQLCLEIGRCWILMANEGIEPGNVLEEVPELIEEALKLEETGDANVEAGVESIEVAPGPVDQSQESATE